jgi:N-acetylglucosamine kinase-like BadF-type ATPase
MPGSTAGWLRSRCSAWPASTFRGRRSGSPSSSPAASGRRGRRSSTTRSPSSGRAGSNCVGVGPDGRHVRFPALGAITGDWGGGYDVGLAAVSKAARSFDGRGAKTTLEQAVPAHFGFETPYELAEAIHGGRVDQRRVLELARVVFAEAEHDEVALAGAAIDRLAVNGSEVEVLLGGGLLQGENSRVVERIRAGLPGISVRVTGAPPIVGAALLALDELGADENARARARAELSEVVDG